MKDPFHLGRNVHGGSQAVGVRSRRDHLVPLAASVCLHAGRIQTCERVKTGVRAHFREPTAGARKLYSDPVF